MKNENVSKRVTIKNLAPIKGNLAKLVELSDVELTVVSGGRMSDGGTSGSGGTCDG